MTDIKRKNLNKETDTQRIEIVKRKAEERSPEQIFPSQSSQGTNPADTLISRLQNHEMITFYCISHSVSGTSLAAALGN